MSLVRKPQGVLTDISGVLKDGTEDGNDIAIPHSVDAFKRLMKSGVPTVLCTNESTYSTDQIAEKLQKLGFPVSYDKLISPVSVMKQVIKDEGYKPYFLVHARVQGEFGVSSNDPDTVIVGDAEDDFTYNNMDKTFRHLVKGDKKFFCLGKSKFYKDKSVGLKLDVGCFVTGLEYSSQCKAECIGKPSAMFFTQAAKILGVSPDQCVMIGDDIESDIGGSMAAGLQGILVRTGKFRPEKDENHAVVRPTMIVDNFSSAVDAILSSL